MMLAYFINDNGSISIENIDILKKMLGRYSTYYFMNLAQAKREHRKRMDLKNVQIEWIKVN